MCLSRVRLRGGVFLVFGLCFGSWDPTMAPLFSCRWEFNADGVCEEIPYCDGSIPAQAKVKTYALPGLPFGW